MRFHLRFLSFKFHKPLKIKILIIEDNRETALVLGEYLQDFGFDSEVAITGKEAIEKFNKSSFDIVLADFKLPDIDGQTVVTKFRHIHPDIKVIFLTAHYLSLKNANTLVLEKPCRPRKILEAINKMLLS
ncbi:MAG: response regulator [Caldithrix sp.]|nr:MAG: response regulator [Caldithrix sp.]